ncbi:hypothetical protein RvY_08333 [Ramazzottius varieornatus]|uniref:Uncharacterized protein n=1 Tax=Ramazzottius varieornatus TaxID=947166 RepID=A0A1D1V7T7_RAMVA|nr:hypothetical protein RvY_08333 [Ramazzottius varieornatus]
MHHELRRVLGCLRKNYTRGTVRAFIPTPYLNSGYRLVEQASTCPIITFILLSSVWPLLSPSVLLLTLP